MLWACLAGLYLLVAGLEDGTEIVAAALTGMVVAALFTLLSAKSRARYSLGARSLPALLVHVPFKVIRDTWLIIYSVGNWLLRGTPIEGFIHRVPYRPTPEGDPNTRIALITAVSSIPPNTIAIGYRKGEFIMHQLVGPPVKDRDGEWPL